MKVEDGDVNKVRLVFSMFVSRCLFLENKFGVGGGDLGINV